MTRESAESGEPPTEESYGRYKGGLYTSLGIGIILGINGAIIGIVGVLIYGVGSPLSIAGLVFFVLAFFCLVAALRIHRKMSLQMKRDRSRPDHTDAQHDDVNQPDTSSQPIAHSGVTPTHSDGNYNLNVTFFPQYPHQLAGLPSYEDVLKERGEEIKETETTGHLSVP